ncbi:zinc finger protein 655-like isoform X1 [Ptychodera flava]|uniref:zinc finger protein 655-like isoform X1 n=1 Tax=Ptychodera flava TaxID=63121 RepID=UPI00396A947F
MPEPVHEIDAESQFSREGDKDAMDHAESDMQCKCVQCMGSVQSVELIQCRAMLKLPMGKDCGEFFRSLALFRLHEKHHNMAVSRVTCPSCLQTFPLFGNCGEHFWNAHNDGTTWQDDDPHLPAAESENYIQEYSEQQSENDVGHNMEPQPQFEILASENQSDSVVVNTCSESLSSRNYNSEVSRSKHYTCKLCGELFNPFSLFCLHVKQRAQGVSTNTCPMCGQTFSSFCSLGRHFKNVHKNKITSVNMISIGNTSENKPGDYSKQGPQSCSLSSQSIDGSVNGASTDDEYAAIDDEGNGTIKRSKYWCQKCGKKFFKVLSFKIHESQHEKGLSELQCPLCGWDYAHFNGVLHHFKKQHKSKLEEWGGNKPGDYSKQGPQSGSLSSQSIDGSVNGASTDDEYAAIDDEGNGTIKRSKYWCQKCGKNFFKVFSFKIHESQHEKGLSELQCPLCGWDYAHFKGLLKHFKKQHKSKLEEWGGGK